MVELRVCAEGGHHHDSRIRRHPPDERQRFPAVHLGHEDVEEHGSGVEVAGQLDGFGPVASLADDLEPSVVLEEVALQEPDVLVVVDNQDGDLAHRQLIVAGNVGVVHCEKQTQPTRTDTSPRRTDESTLYDRGMSLEWEQTIVDAKDPEALGRWWLEALGWVAVNEDPEEFEIRPAPDRPPGLLFVRVPEPKQHKNRVHLDFRPDDRDAEVERLVGLGATRADVGQGEQSWVVLADPEGNEFCVLRSLPLTS